MRSSPKNTFLLDPAIKSQERDDGVTYYRWPVILAVLLHLVIFVLLISSMFSPHSTSYVEQKVVQANLVSSAQLSAMMPQKPQAVHSASKPPPPTQQPEKVLPVKSQPQQMPKPIFVVSPVKPVLKKVQPPKPMPVVTKPLVKPITKKEQQKLIEESVLQEESTKTSTQKNKMN